MRFGSADFIARFGKTEWDGLMQRHATNTVSTTSTSTASSNVAVLAAQTAVFNTLVADVLAEVDSLLSSHFDLSTSLPPLVMSVTADLVRAKLYQDAPTENVLARKEQAYSILNDLVQGKRQLKEQTSSLPKVKSDNETFTSLVLKNF